MRKWPCYPEFAGLGRKSTLNMYSWWLTETYQIILKDEQKQNIYVNSISSVRLSMCLFTNSNSSKDKCEWQFCNKLYTDDNFKFLNQCFYSKTKQKTGAGKDRLSSHKEDRGG